MNTNNKYITALLCLVLYVSPTNAQGLKAGQKMPPLVLRNVINYPDSIIKLTDLKGKVILFDFWSTGCSVCIKSFGKLDSLQKKYNGRLQIILVDQQGKDIIEPFFAARKKIKKPALPMATGNKQLFNLFPRKALPYIVWMDDKNIIRNITEGYDLTDKTLQAFLDGDNPVLSQLPEKNTLYKTAIREDLLKNVKYYSYLGNWKKELSPGSTNAMDFNGQTSLCKTVASVAELYRVAYSEKGKYQINPGNFILEVSDRFKYEVPKDQENIPYWKANYCYTYELVLPTEKAKDIYKYMQQDLDRYFGLDFRKEKRIVKCLVLKRISNEEDKLKTKGGTPRNTFFASENWKPNDDSLRCLVNQPFNKLTGPVKACIIQLYHLPFIDETNYTENIDIALPEACIDPFNIQELIRGLKQYGLLLTEESREVEVFVLKER